LHAVQDNVAGLPAQERHASPSTGAVAAAEALGFSFGTAAALQETIAGQQESVNSSILGLQ
jgi:hypothetical protein